MSKKKTSKSADPRVRVVKTKSGAAGATTVRETPATIPDDARKAAWPVRAAEEGRALAIACAQSLDQDKCEDVMILDVRGVCQICDFIVLATGTSDRQMRAAADHVDESARQLGEKVYHTSGYEEGTWIVVDFVDVVVHLFSGEMRGYYDLESLWGDGVQVEWNTQSK